MSGVTSMLGGGTGPATGTFATTCTPGAWNIQRMLQAAEAFPMNLGFMGKGNASLPAALHEQVQAGPEFVELRRRLRGWVFPMSAAFLLWYFAYVVLASYARELMATPVSGVITVGLLVWLAQFVSTFALTAAYVRFAARRLDPLAAQIRHSMEDGR